MFCAGVFNKLKLIKKEYERLDSSGAIDKAIALTTNLRNALNSTVANIIIDIIPGNLDAAARNAMVNVLDTSIKELDIIKGCSTLPNIQDKITCLIDKLAGIGNVTQDALIVKLLSLLIKGLDSAQLKQHYYDTIAQTAVNVKLK